MGGKKGRAMSRSDVIKTTNHFEELNTLDDLESSGREHNEAFDKRDHSEYHPEVDTNRDCSRIVLKKSNEVMADVLFLCVRRRRRNLLQNCPSSSDRSRQSKIPSQNCDQRKVRFPPSHVWPLEAIILVRSFSCLEEHLNQMKRERYWRNARLFFQSATSYCSLSPLFSLFFVFDVDHDVIEM